MRKGFAALIYLLGFAALSALIIAALFFIKNNSNPILTKTGIANLVNSSKSNESGKILFITQDGKLALASKDGNSIEPFNPKLNEELKEVGAGTNASSVSPDRKHLLVEALSTSKEIVHYIVSLENKSYVKIDESAIKNQFGYPIIYFWTWTSDSNKIVYSATQRPDKPPGNIRRSIGTYDINTKEVKEIYSEQEYKTDFFPGRFGVIYYDIDKQLLTYTDDNAKTLNEAVYSNARLKGYQINLTTKKKIQFKEPDTYNNSSVATGKYFAVGKLDSQRRIKGLEIFASQEPSNSISNVDFEATGGSAAPWIKWSPNYDSFAIEVFGAQPTPNQNYDVFIYSRDGKLISRTAIGYLQGSPGTDIIFSGDGQRVLVYGEFTGGEFPKKVLWKFYDIAGKEKPNDVTSTNLGRAIYWFN